MGIKDELTYFTCLLLLLCMGLGANGDNSKPEVMEIFSQSINKMKPGGKITILYLNLRFH